MVTMTDTPNPEMPVAATADAVGRALRGAVASVEASIVRLEGDDAPAGVVPHVLDLAGTAPPSCPDGDIVAAHNALTRAAGIVDHRGTLPDGEWSPLAPLGPELTRVAAALRAHAAASLDGLDAETAVGEHMEQLQKIAVDAALGETLQLLVLVEACLFLWHRVHIALADGSGEPDALGAAREALAAHFDADAAVLRRSRAALARLAEGTPIEVVRRLSSTRAKRVFAGLRQDLDDVRWAFRADDAGWLDGEDPAVAEALDAIDSPLKAVGEALGEAFERGRARVAETWARDDA